MPPHFSTNPDVVTRRIGGETLLVPICGQAADLEAIFTLDEVGSRVWSLLEAGQPLPQIVQTLCAEYDVSPEEAERDVRELLLALQEARLVRAAQEDDH